MSAIKRSDEIEIALTPGIPVRTRTMPHAARNRARPSEMTTHMMASGFPSVKSYSPERMSITQ